jgi:hypothetical protein
LAPEMHQELEQSSLSIADVGKGCLHGQYVANTKSVGLGHLDDAQTSQTSLVHGCSISTFEESSHHPLCLMHIRIAYLEQYIPVVL